MKPIDVLLRAIERTLTHDHARRPGAVIERMPATERDILRGLTSDDALKMRPDLVLPRRRA